MQTETPDGKTRAELFDDFPEFPRELLGLENPVEIFTSSRIEPTHPAEPDLFARHDGVPAHNQELLETSRIVLIGGGGLNSWAGIGLTKSGARTITVVDDDRVEITNLPRQFFFGEDLGEPKGLRLAKNLAAHAIAGATVTGIGLRFEEAVEMYTLAADVFVCGVDNNACRLEVAREARGRKVPAIFTMLSTDGMRVHSFLQNASPLEPCLWCALPNLDPENVLPCASAIVSACFLASSITIFFTHRALMGWGKLRPFNWRGADLSGMTPEHIGNVEKRPGCPVCKDL